jgi:hypothetical protein
LDLLLFSAFWRSTLYSTLLGLGLFIARTWDSSSLMLVESSFLNCRQYFAILAALFFVFLRFWGFRADFGAFSGLESSWAP